MSQTTTLSAPQITHLVSVIKLSHCKQIRRMTFYFTHLFRSPEEKRVNPLSNSPKLKSLFFLDAQVLRVTDPPSVGYAWTGGVVSPTSLKWSPFSLTVPGRGHFSGPCSGSHPVCVRETAENQEIHFLSSGFYRVKHTGESLRLSHSHHIIKKLK